MKQTPLRKNPYLKWGIALLIVIFAGVYYSIDRVIMPHITRQDEIISVPDVLDKPLPDALAEIMSAELVLGDTTSRIGPDHLQGLVASQSPRPNAPVKTGRRIYLSIYQGSEPDVSVPDVIAQSLRNARLALRSSGLVVRSEQPDTIPSPHPDIVTRIRPVAGTVVSRGDSVTVWVGRGLNPNRLVEVPNVVGLRYSEAEKVLRPLFFWPNLLDQEEEMLDPLIRRQSPESGELVPAGSTLRLFATSN